MLWMTLVDLRHKFTVTEFHRLAEAGILREDHRVELLQGDVVDMHPPRFHRFTVDEYYKMGDIGILSRDERVDLIEGEIVEITPIGSHHLAAVNTLAELLMEQLKGRAIVSVQNPIRLNENSQPQPDIAVLAFREDRYRTDIPAAANVLLVIEVADSSLAGDQDVKLPLYARSVIPEAWIVNLVNDEIEVYQSPANGTYPKPTTYKAGQTIASRTAGGFSVAVSQVIG